jgi:hypothetical protein
MLEKGATGDLKSEDDRRIVPGGEVEAMAR